MCLRICRDFGRMKRQRMPFMYVSSDHLINSLGRNRPSYFLGVISYHCLRFGRTIFTYHGSYSARLELITRTKTSSRDTYTTEPENKPAAQRKAIICHRFWLNPKSEAVITSPANDDDSIGLRPNLSAAFPHGISIIICTIEKSDS
jgi:hypothetical protein